jgi:hypothetical protein
MIVARRLHLRAGSETPPALARIPGRCYLPLASRIVAMLFFTTVVVNIGEVS